MLFAHPLGVGFDQSREHMADYGNDWNILPHNTYVKVAAEAGIPGFIAYVVIFYVTLNRLMKIEYHYRRIAPDRKVAIIQALLFSLIAFMVNTSFSQKEYEWLLYILLACSARLIDIECHVCEGKSGQQWIQQVS
jgi:O-antigen ligase